MASRKTANARSLALQILREVLGGRGFAAERLDFHLNRQILSEADRAFCTQLVYGVLREQGYLDQVLGRYVAVKKTPAGVFLLLRLAAYQGLFLQKVPDYALVNESVALAKSRFGIPPSRLVNAVLRRLLRDREELLAEGSERFAACFPAWLVGRWRGRYGSEGARRLFEYFQAVPPVGIRVNRLRADPEALLREWGEQGVNGVRLGSGPLLSLSAYHREILAPSLAQGRISIQDPHSFRVAEAVAAQPEERGLDACAGHGGKSSAIAESVGDRLELWAHEPNPRRRAELQENFRRLGLKEPSLLASPAAAKQQGLSFDWILVDAPCSGLGTLGRKPEIRWRVREDDLPDLARQQGQILREWWPFLKPGGRLVYAVCSLEPEEGEQVLADLLKTESELRLEQAREWSPLDSPGDGFFVANLRRRE
ncbi:MAG: 16S rRNA (cytosine(967)-C(5))-methyltransferase RsmB [bacterium]